jgi:hypothetical protein
MWIIIGLCVLLAIGGYFAISKNSNPNGLNVKDTNAYENDDYGIAFSFPEKYVLEEREVGTPQEQHHTITLITKADKEEMSKSTSTPREGPMAITIDIYSNPRNTSLEQWLSESPDSGMDRIIGGFSTTTIGGLPAVAYQSDGLYTANNIVMMHGTKIVKISMTFLRAEDEIWKDFPVVLQSLRFY